MAATNMDDIAELFKTLKFRKKLFGGVDEMQVWKQLDRIQKEYRFVYVILEEQYKARLQERDEEIAALKEQLSRVNAYE